jgi:DNA invertase Pin-like site-specific DNA recombinase
MKYGYARVSTISQNMDMQIEKLKEAGCDEIYAEKESGGKIHRKKLNMILEKIQPGDYLVLYDLSRLGRTGSKLQEIMEDFEARNINFIFLDMDCDTSTIMGRFFFKILAAIHEMQREEIRRKVIDGIAFARSQGRVGGKPTVLHPHVIKRAKELYKILPADEAMKALGIGKSSFYKALKIKDESLAA